ncbi:MAG: methionine--tRNA ligase [Candidatus Diapherotrites archaeon]|uniref:methionine--tRNA ligase n=1 Tax=Candidatus Iainarchaeum sp. TaxID=3101447 RepID=A0A8T3YLZ4_9ARCH|nr:methionine--tRNA ligase [Candidatus Diapherotrites archaeon]
MKAGKDSRGAKKRTGNAKTGRATGIGVRSAKGQKGMFYITTAIDYPNSKPHLGHAYEKTVADCIARWHRLKGEDVFFLTGTDEHGKKIQQAAEKAGKPPKEFVDWQVTGFKELCVKWGVSHDRFIRTTDQGHERMCQGLFQKALDSGDIYLGTYDGLYCVACEAFYLEKDLDHGLCPVHRKPVENVKEESYFFRMSKYQKRWLVFMEKNQGFIFPKSKRAEVVNRVREGLHDLSVSRTTFDWGIPLKSDPKHVIYVWFDALLNYLSGVDWPSAKSKKFWPADIHVIGVDILWFHSVIWPTMLFSLGIELPKKILVHGFIRSASGEKLSKTTGAIVDPLEVGDTYGVDSVRYYLLREIPLGEDGNFSEAALVERHNRELANDLGNLLNRTMSLAEKKLNGIVPKAKVDQELAKQLGLKKIVSHMDALEPHMALAEIFSFVSACNRYVNGKEVWKLEGKQAEAALYSLLDSLRVIAILLSPFMPDTAVRISGQLNVPLGSWKDLKFGLLRGGKRLGTKEILFVKKDVPAEAKAQVARDISVSIEPRLDALGLKLACAVVEGVSVKKKHEGLDRSIRETVKAADLSAVEASGVIQGYLELYDALGVPRQRHAVANLVEIARQSGKLPTINTVVDSYNLTSITRGFIVGAHDLDRVSGNVRVKIADGSEVYIPLGAQEAVPVKSGEYVFVDDKVVLCHLDVKQGEHTKVTNETRNVFLYVQGNARTPQRELDSAMEEICGNIVKFCGGKWKRVEVSVR